MVAVIGFKRSYIVGDDSFSLGAPWMVTLDILTSGSRWLGEPETQ